MGALLAAIGALKLGLGALLLFGILFEAIVTTLGNLQRMFAGKIPS